MWRGGLREDSLARLFVIFGGFLVLLLTAALVAPLFVDWTSYRAQFEAEASKILGRPVTVAGTASARILPFPSVTFEDVRVGEDKAKPVLTMDRFSMDAELAPFLSGEVLIFDMRVTNPHGVVTIGADGAIDWALRPDSPFDPRQVRIENLVVEGGQIEINDEATGARHFLDISDATVSARALTGPWRVNAKLLADGEPLTVQVSTGQVGDDGELALRMQIFPTGRAVAIEADGTAKSDDGKLSYSGTFGLRPAALTDPAAPALRDGDGKAAADGEAFRVSGLFELKSEALTLPEFRLETGAKEDPYVANGKGSVTFGMEPRFDLTVDGTQVTFNDKTDKVTAGSGVTERIAAFRSFVDIVPVPTMPGALTVNLPAIVAGDTTIREVAFSAEPEGEAWRVRGLKATLPGRTRLEADGLLSRAEEFGFTGKLLVASNQPAGLANWLTGEVDPAIRKLSAAGFSADVELDPTVQRLDNLEVAIGSASLKGSAVRRADGARPVLELVLKGGAFELDALNAMAAGVISGTGGNRLGGHDLTLTLDVGPVSAGDVEAQALGLSVRLKQDRADIDRLMITQLAGASLSATGTVTGFPDKTAASLDASVVSVDGAEFISMLAARFGEAPGLATLNERIAATPGLLDDVQLSIVSSTAPDDEKRAWSVSGTLKAASGEASFSGNAKGALGDPAALAGSWQASVKQDEPLNFLSLAGISLVPLGAPGPATLEISANGSLRTGLLIDTVFAADGTSATLAGTVKADAFDGKAGLISNDLDPYLMAVGLAFPGTGLGTPVSFSADVRKTGPGFALSALDASVADIKAKGDVTLTLAERNRLDGTLLLNYLDTTWLLENLMGPGTFSVIADGAAPPFATEPLVPVDGRIALSADSIWLGPLGIGGAAKALLTMQPNGLRLEGLETSLAEGTATGNFEASNNGGDGAVSGDFLVKGARFEQLVGQRAVSGATDVSGSLSATGKSADALAAALTGSGVVSLREGSISGINPDGFSALLADAGASETAPTESDVKALVGSKVLSGAFSFKDVDAAWTAAGGRIKIPSFRAVGDKAVVSADIDADVTDASVMADGTISYAAGNDAVTGAETVVPFHLVHSAAVTSFETDAAPMGQYLTQRALEREQARVEAMQAALIEKQRLRRDVRALQLAYAARDARALKLEEALREAGRRQGEMARARWETEKARLEEEARAKAEADEKARVEAEAAAKALEEAEAKAKSEAEAAAKAKAAKDAEEAAKALKLTAPDVKPDPGFDSGQGQDQRQYERRSAQDLHRRPISLVSATNSFR